MRLTITAVDYAPLELYDQIPLTVELLRELPGPDRPDYWLGMLETPIHWLEGKKERKVRHLLLAARWQGTRIESGVTDLPVGIAYVTDESVLGDKEVAFEKCEYTAIGLITDIDRIKTTAKSADIMPDSIRTKVGKDKDP